MNQSHLFFEQPEDAFSHLVSVMGGAKAVGARMRPDLAPDAAGRWLKDALNADRREQLHPSQVIWLLKAAREAGIHDAMRWMAGECGYTTPDPTSPPDEMAELQRQFIAASKQMQNMTARMESIAGSVQWAAFGSEKRRA
jgi:hypothetical protein